MYLLPYNPQATNQVKGEKMGNYDWDHHKAVGTKLAQAIEASGLYPQQVWKGICSKAYYRSVIRGAVPLSDEIRRKFAAKLGISPEELTV